MKRKSFIFSDLSKEQLSHLKEFYIQEKIDSMSNKELRDFVLEIITHQITDTIDKEEEMEAWLEMSDFFGDKFETIISTIKEKYNDFEQLENIKSDSHEDRKDLLEKNNIEKEKMDMWND